jgi:protein TonB
MKRTRYVAPVYPRAALEDNVSGEVRVRITVDAEGKVTDTVIVESTPAGVFDDAALAAVRRWRFKPAEVDGRPVESSSIQSLLFRLGDGT